MIRHCKQNLLIFAIEIFSCIIMTVQDLFEKRKEAQIQRRALEARVEIEANPDLWTKCVHCDAQLLKKDIEENNMVCPVCDYHFRVN